MENEKQKEIDRMIRDLENCINKGDSIEEIKEIKEKLDQLLKKFLEDK